MVQQNSAQKAYCWLNQVPELHHRRAPAVTCIQVLSDKAIGTIEHPTNSSKGSAGVMRVAPIGAFFDPRQMPQTEIDRLGRRGRSHHPRQCRRVDAGGSAGCI